jgi:hypothetical protein
MCIKRTNWSYDLDKCLVEWDHIKIYPDMRWKTFRDGSSQTYIQRNPKILSNHFIGGVQRSAFRGINSEGRGRTVPSVKVDLDFNMLNEIYEGSIFEDIIRDVNGVRSRIMVKTAHTSYSVHQDKTPRYHLALITNPNAYFLFPTMNEIIHIPADGYVYEVDTTLPHSFVNCGPADRTHLVISKMSSS